MKRFEMISLAALAGMLRRGGARDEALAVSREAWRLCLEVGAQAFGGALVLVEIAALTPNADEAERALQQAEELLDRGAVAHCHLVGLPEIMRLRLTQGRYDEVLRLADRLENYVRDEPNFWASHHAAAARALVRAARAPLDDGLRGELQRLLAQAQAARLLPSAQELERALR